MNKQAALFQNVIDTIKEIRKVRAEYKKEGVMEVILEPTTDESLALILADPKLVTFIERMAKCKIKLM